MSEQNNNYLKNNLKTDENVIEIHDIKNLISDYEIEQINQKSQESLKSKTKKFFYIFIKKKTTKMKKRTIRKD